MNKHSLTKASKFLSLILRHKPDTIALTLDAHGWASVETLIERTKESATPFTREILEELVHTCPKKRFEFNEDKSLIRCQQGHSVAIDLGIEECIPPEVLYHGTATKNLESILKEGLKRGNRHHVHLSKDIQTAHKVGQRHGSPIVLTIRSKAMHDAGHCFYLSGNGVWLTESVPVDFIIQES